LMTEKPKIVAYACTYCSYPGADLAGTSRIKYSPHINIVRVLCSGRISPELILRTFREGADGVLVLGCHYGDCHFISGNHRTAKRVAVLRRILEYAGIDPARLRLEWVSASEGERFAQVVNEFTETIRQLEPMELVLA
jgi:F420-non-reducing hydrogenase iron-sulfur subunit